MQHRNSSISTKNYTKNFQCNNSPIAVQNQQQQQQIYLKNHQNKINQTRTNRSIKRKFLNFTIKMEEKKEFSFGGNRDERQHREGWQGIQLQQFYERARRTEGDRNRSIANPWNRRFLGFWVLSVV